MCGKATFATEVSRTSMKVAAMTATAISHGLCRGRHNCSCSAMIRWLRQLLLRPASNPGKDLLQDHGRARAQDNRDERQNPLRHRVILYSHARKYRHARAHRP